MTLIVGNPGETDEDCKATLDLIYEVERRGLFAFFIPSIFTPLHDTRMESQKGVTETRELTPLQWQLIMKCWKMNLRPGQNSWWGPTAWRVGALALWAYQLRKLNGPGFTWPLFMFASALPEAADGAGSERFTWAAGWKSRPARSCWRRSSRITGNTSGRTPETCRTVSSTSRRRSQRPGSSRWWWPLDGESAWHSRRPRRHESTKKKSRLSFVSSCFRGCLLVRSVGL